MLRDNREHWGIENDCHYLIDWNYDEDRSRIRKGHGPENITRLRRFAVGLIKSKGVRSVAQKMRELNSEYARGLRLSENDAKYVPCIRNLAVRTNLPCALGVAAVLHGAADDAAGVGDEIRNHEKRGQIYF